jgi:hypothetical protein
MKIVQFLLDYIDPSPAKKRDEQAKQYIIGISILKKRAFVKGFIYMLTFWRLARLRTS